MYLDPLKCVHFKNCMFISKHKYFKYNKSKLFQTISFNLNFNFQGIKDIIKILYFKAQT